MDKPIDDSQNATVADSEGLSRRGNDSTAPDPNVASADGNLDRLKNLHKEVTNAENEIKKICECVDNIRKGDQLYNKFTSELNAATEGPAGHKETPEKKAIENYKTELDNLKKTLEEDSPEKFKQAKKARDRAKSVDGLVAKARGRVVADWDYARRSLELSVLVHGYNHLDERKNYKPVDMKMFSSIPRESIPRTFMDFWGLILVFFIVETFVNGLVYAGVTDGLLEGWGIAAAIAFLVVAFGLVCGYCSSFLKGFEKNNNPGGLTTASDALLKKIKLVAILILIVVSIAAWLYFDKHAGDLDFSEKLIPVIILVVVLGAVFWILFFKDATLQNKDADLQEYWRTKYRPRSIPKRLLCLVLTITCLTIGISLIMLAYLYREEMLLYALHEGDTAGNVVGIMQNVWKRFSEVSLMPKPETEFKELMKLIVLLVINLGGFALSAWKGHSRCGPFQDYKTDREFFEKDGAKYDEDLADIEIYYNEINKAVNNVLDNDYLLRRRQECSELYSNIETLLLKKLIDAKEIFREKTGRDAAIVESTVDFKPKRRELFVEEK